MEAAQPSEEEPDPAHHETVQSSLQQHPEQVEMKSPVPLYDWHSPRPPKRPKRPVQLTPVVGLAAAHLPPPHLGHHPVVGELPSPENIAAMSYDELLRFAGEIGTSPLDELD